jgi:hypothetical protein
MPTTVTFTSPVIQRYTSLKPTALDNHSTYITFQGIHVLGTEMSCKRMSCADFIDANMNQRHVAK